MALLSLGYPLRSLIVPAALLLAGLPMASAQDNSAVAAAPQAALPASITAAPSPDWRNDIGTFKIGLVRGWSSDMSRLALLRVEDIFATALGTSVKVVVFERFTSLMDAQADGRIDLAAYSARAFATVRLVCECVEAVATPTTISGDNGQIAIVVGDGARTAGFINMAAVKLGRVATESVASRDMLQGSFIVDGKPVNGNEPFWVDYPNYLAASKAYQNNEIDGFVIPAAASLENRADAGTKELRLMAAAQTEALRPASILWRSSFWPYGPVATRSNLANEPKAIILKLLEQMDITAPLVHATLSEGLAGPFRKADIAGFANVNASIRTLVSQNANWR